MKAKQIILSTIASLVLLSILSSCSQDKIDPALVLDEVFIPEGYHQIDNPSMDALTRLEELRMENPKDYFYYLERENKEVGRSRDWVFPQKELKIEHADFEENKIAAENPKLQGVIVKKITGNWQNEEFKVFEQQPQPEHGMKALYDYISENLKYPEEAKNAGVAGRVFVEFIVDKDGKLTDVKAVKGIGAGCDEEAVRVLKASPKWIPASVMDMPVKVRMILPITYKLS